MRKLGLLALLLALGAGVASADTVTLKNGRVITGKVTEQGPRVTIDHGCGKISIPRSLIHHIDFDDSAPVGTTTRPKS